MGSTNIGGQILTFDYLQEAKSEDFNRLNHKILGQGILEGGDLTKVTNTSIDIDPFLCIIRDDSNETTIRLETTTTATITCSNAEVFIIIRFAWINSENNYADLLAVAEGSIQSTDLILGRCVYDGATLSATFDYSRKDNHPFNKVFDDNQAFNVRPTELNGATVYVEAGDIYINDQYVEYTGGASPAITVTAGNPRIDLVSIDDTGTIVITQGVASVSPVQPDFPEDSLVLAILTLPASLSPMVVDGTMITNIDYSKYSAQNYDTDIANIISDVTDIETELTGTVGENAIFSGGGAGLEGGASIAHTSDTGSVSNTKTNEVVGSTASRTHGIRAQINVSNICDAVGICSQINASDNSDTLDSAGFSQQINASSQCTVDGSYAQVDSSLGCDAEGTNVQINASQNSDIVDTTGSTTEQAQINCSNICTITDIEEGQINCSNNCAVEGNTSQVNASRDSCETHASMSVISASQFNCQTLHIHSVVLASENVLTGIANSVCGGDGSSPASSANRTWEMDSQNGNIYGSGTVSGGHTFSDYKEMFENLEEGIIEPGLLLTLIEDKVKLADKDDYILGVCSQVAGGFLGADSAFCWSGRYLLDEFGRYIMEEKIIDNQKIMVKKESPDYDHSKGDTYIRRSQRPKEWTPVGMVGQVPVQTKGAIKAGMFLKPDKGYGIKTETPTSIRTMRQLTNNVWLCVIK